MAITIKFASKAHSNPSRFLTVVMRSQSTCTMDLVSLDYKPHQPLHSTLQYSVERDFYALKRSNPYRQVSKPMKKVTVEQQWQAIMKRSRALSSSAVGIVPSGQVEAREMDLVEAARNLHKFDKIVLLMQHGEDESQLPPPPTGKKVFNPFLFAQKNHPKDSLLTGRGVGQSLNMARRTATFCTPETGLVPELIVSAPNRRCLQTALYAFPQYTPASCTSTCLWVCHPQAAATSQTSSGEEAAFSEDFYRAMEKEFRGVDYSLCYEFAKEPSQPHSKEDDVAHSFLEWLELRPEQVISVSSQSTWLEAFGNCLNYTGGSSLFQNGELRAVGLNFLDH